MHLTSTEMTCFVDTRQPQTSVALGSM